MDRSKKCFSFWFKLWAKDYSPLSELKIKKQVIYLYMLEEKIIIKLLSLNLKK